MKYFIYTRKSTDSEERQILSIESQLAELREFATKEPGRKIFDEMLDRICAGEASGILACFASKIIFTTEYLNLKMKFIREVASQLLPRNFLILLNK